MADSNFSGFQEGQYFWNGNAVTYERYRYEATRQQEAVLKQVNDIMTKEAASAVAPGANMDLQEFGGLLRAVVPTLLDKYGQVNATAAIQFYDQIRTTWLTANGEQARQYASRGNVKLQADRYAKAGTKSAVAVAQGYLAQYADDYKTAERTDAVVNWAMKVRSKHGHQPSVDAMANAMTREVGAYHRDTIVFNAGLDPYVHKVQRVAQASACPFCRLMALGSTNGSVRTSNYAVHFHSHCHCTIQPLFEGEAPVRPDYYDQFEAQYQQASAGKHTLENWRNLEKNNKFTGKAAVELPKPRVAPEAKAAAVVAPTGPYSAAEAASRVVSPMAPDPKGGWWWQKEYKASRTKQELVQGHNNQIYALRRNLPLDEGTNTELARTLPLREVRENLKTLDTPELALDSVEKTNPKYDVTKSAYSSNCARVVQAYELRRRGFDVTASKYVAKDASQAPLIYGQYWKNPTTGKTLYQELEDRGTKVDGEWSKKSYSGFTSYDDYIQRLAVDYPPGSRGVVQVQWSKGKMGHIFGFEVKKNGSVYLLDAQTGKVGRELEHYFARGTLWKSARMDDKEPMAGVLQYLEGGVK